MSIRKLRVTTGVYYLEIPEAGFNLLCGSPADSIKHLLRRGIIQTCESGGTLFENGPTAILLSDAMVQNGQLCNLAEFPVLQMLYRQGLHIPAHPNNSGRRPRLIGAPEVLAAQLRYIHRGNYGLVSVEEMVAVGVPEAEAEARMRQKLKFAFGQIVSPEQFVDCVTLGHGPTDLGRGVGIERLAHNLFEICHAGQSVQVDLNLDRHESYPCPYPLTPVGLSRHYFAVVHAGDGDGWDFDNPALGSVLIHQGRVYLVDAGPNIQYSLDALGIGLKEVAGIFHTHCHDDHFAGLTTLLQCDQPLHYYATPLVRASVARKLCALLSMPHDEFARYFDVHDLAENQWNDIMGLEVMPVPSPHPTETTVFKFRVLWEGGYRTYHHLADIASFALLDSMRSDDTDLPGMSAADVEAVKAAYLEPADIKKLDIGGGMIHGEARDFAADRSKRLLLGHLSRPLTDAERRIGSGAPFGTLDVLIPGEQSFLLRDASEFLKRYFPAVPIERLHMLLNNRIETFNPETIMISAGQAPREIYLLLAGKVEMLTGDSPATHFLFSGSLIAEAAALNGRKTEETYRSVGFVQALRLPVDLYRNFVERFHSSADLLALRQIEERLRRSYLFSDGVTNLTLHTLAQVCQVTELHPGEYFQPADACLHIVARGRLAMGQDDPPPVLGKHAFWGSDILFQDMARGIPHQEAGLELPSQVVALDGSAVISLPLASVAHIPVVRWKLFEAFRNAHPYAAPRYRGTPR